MNTRHLSVNLLATHWSSPLATCLHPSPGVTRNFSFDPAVRELSPTSLGRTCKRGEISSLLLSCEPGLSCKARGQTLAKPQLQQVDLCLQRQFDDDAAALSPPAHPSVIPRVLLLACRAQAFPWGIQLRREPCPSPPAPLSCCRLAELPLSDPPSGTVLH